MRKKLWRSTTALLIAAAALAGCSTGGSNTESTKPPSNNVKANSNTAACGQNTRTIKHELGSTTITGTPQRVVVLEFSFADALVAVNEKPVGVADDNDPGRIIPQIRSKISGYTSVGLRQSPSLQVISSLKPDLIIGDTERDKAIYKQLSQIAPTIVFSSLDADYQENINVAGSIGAALNKCSEMDARIAQHQATMAALKAKIPAGQAPQFLFAVSSPAAFSGYAANGYASSVLESIGFKSVLPADKGTGQVVLNLESFSAAKPPIVFAASIAGKKTLMDSWKTSSLYKSIPAVQDNKLFVVDQNLWSRNRGLTAAELIAQNAINLLYGS
jgi:ferric citrate transport system substrate-binding protein